MPVVTNVKDREAGDPGKDAEDHCLGNEADQDIADTHRQAGHGVFVLVLAASHQGIEDRFGQQQ